MENPKPGPGNLFGPRITERTRQATQREAPAHRGTPRLSTFRPPSARGRPSGPEPRTIFRPAGWTPAAPSKQPDRNAIKSCKSLRGRTLEPGAARRVAADRKPGPFRRSGTARHSPRRRRRSGADTSVRKNPRTGKPECKSSANSRTGSSSRQNRNGVPDRRGAVQRA